MKKPIASLFPVALMLLFCSVPFCFLTAQNYSLTVDNGAATGSYGAQIALFGPDACEVPMLSGELAVAEDASGDSRACAEVATDVDGKIAIIDRGDCFFSNKVFNAQQQGAIAVLIINNEAGSDYLNMSGGDAATQVTIPSFFVLQNDGTILRNALAEGVVSISLTRNDVVDDFDGEIIYMEDFGGGLNDWVATGLSCNGAPAENATWEWSEYGRSYSDCYQQATFQVPSPSRCNGAVFFNSGGLDNGGICDNQGTGSCPAPQLAELRSPAIDLTGSDAVSYSLRFHQVAVQFTSGYFVSWSFDGGTTWADTTAINTNLERFDITGRNFTRVPLAGSGEADSVVVRFLIAGNYYLWGIDDVQIVGQEANNLRVNSDFYAIPPNAIYPLSQVEPISFLADIENIGALRQPNTTLNVTIVNDQGITVFDEDLTYGNVPGNTLVENVPFGPTFTPADTGSYFGVYSIRSDSMDFDTTDNQQFFQFAVTDGTFAKEFAPNQPILPGSGSWDPGEPHSWAYGNYFYVPNGNGQFVQTVSFALGDPEQDAGQTVALSLYEWPEDSNNDGTADRSEITQVGFDIYTILGTEAPGEVITIPYPTQGDPIGLKDDMAYLLMLEYYAADEDDVVFAGTDVLDYTASVFLSQVQGMPRYAGMIAVEGDLSTANFSSIGFGRDLVPTVRITIDSERPTSTRVEPAVLNDQFHVFPNPAKEQFQVRFALPSRVQEAQLQLFDLAGRLVWQQDVSGVETKQMTIRPTGVVPGAYTLRLLTSAGTGSKRVLIK